MCFDKRKTPVRIICGCSLLAALFGILMIVFAFLFSNNKILEQMEQENSDIEDAKKFVFLTLLIFSLTTIGIASCGFLFKWIENRCFVCTYGIILLPTWIFLVVIGSVAVIASVASTDHINEQCEVFKNEQVTLTEDSSINISLDIYESLGVNKYMCSSYCPCAFTNKSSSWSTLLFSDPDYPLVFDKNSEIKTYQGCIEYYAVKANWDYSRVGEVTTQDLNEFYGFCQEFRGQDSYDSITKWINFFETEYDCAGICGTADFYWSRSIDEGKPTASCIDNIKSDLTNAFVGLGVTTLIAGIFLFFVFIMQYCLWRKY